MPVVATALSASVADAPVSRWITSEISGMFAVEPSITGSSASVNGQDAVVAGVAVPGVAGTDAMGGDVPSEVWTPHPASTTPAATAAITARCIPQSSSWL